MSSFTANDPPAARPSSEVPASEVLANDNGADIPAPPLVRYALGLAMVAAATIVAFVVDHLNPSSSLALVYVLPVVIAAAGFGWGPALAAAVAGALALDFFFVAPRYTFVIADPADIWALALFLAIAAIVSAVAAQSRRRALAAREAADQAQALQALAQAVMQSAPPAAMLRAAAEALARIFQAPAAVFAAQGEALPPPTLAGGAVLSGADQAAARLAFASRVTTRAGSYPVEAADFDFWAIDMAHGRLVLGVAFTQRGGGRPKEPGRLVEAVGAYLALALRKGA